MSGRQRSWLAVGGVVGPASFILAWSVLGQRVAGYSPIEDPISRLAAVDAPSRVPMTVGLCALGAGVGAYAAALPGALPGRAVAAAATTAAASFGVAALPLGSAGGGAAHAVAAGVAYASLAATPLAGARSLRRQGRSAAARVSTVVGVLSGAALLASAVLPGRTGLLQRTGLTLGHLWIVATAVAMLRARRR